jgi:transposase-like protein
MKCVCQCRRTAQLQLRRRVETAPCHLRYIFRTLRDFLHHTRRPHSYPWAIQETLGEEVVHRCSPYLNNRIAQDHHGGCHAQRVPGEQRYYPMRGVESTEAAGGFCRAFDEQRQYFRLRTTMRARIPPLAEQRQVFCVRWTALMGKLMAV